MKKLAVHLIVLAGCALPLVLAAGSGTAGADPIITINDPEVECWVDCGSLAICLSGGSRTTFAMEGCTAIGD